MDTDYDSRLAATRDVTLDKSSSIDVMLERVDAGARVLEEVSPFIIRFIYMSNYRSSVRGISILTGHDVCTEKEILENSFV